MTWVEAVFWTIIGIMLAVAAEGVIERITEYVKHRKFDKYIKELKEKTAELREANKEISELHFRDPSGTLQSVRIIVDHGLTSDEIMGAWRWGPRPSDIKGSKEFIFSALAVKQMRENGIEPDDLVRQMLIASGRMHETKP